MKLRPIRTRPSASNEANTDDALTDPNEDPKARVHTFHKNDGTSDGNAECANAEPVTPAGHAFLDPSINAQILVIIGFKEPVNVDSLKSGLRQTLLKHKRFHSIVQRKTDDGQLVWVPTSVNLDDHIIIVEGDAMSPTFVEEYVANLANTSPLDTSRPLFECHVLRAKLGDARENVIIRVHHAMGDGTSLMSLMLACTRSAEDPKKLPSLPSQAFSSLSAKRSPGKAFLLLVWRFLLLLWYTVLDMYSFVATMLWLEDSPSPLKGSLGVEKLPKALAISTVSMADVRIVKQAIHGTVNDVLFGMAAAGLSQYLQQKYAANLGSEDGSHIKNKCTFESEQKIREIMSHLQVRACVLVNTRPSPGLQEIQDMMKKDSRCRWGNHMGYVVLPVPLVAYGNPLEYVIKAKSVLDKKKQSLGAVLSYKSAAMLMSIFGPEMPIKLTINCLSNTTLSFSNLSGPLEESVFFGHHITHILPTVVGQPQALCIHVQSYMGKVSIVISTAEDVIPDPSQLCKLMASALEEMKKRISQKESLKT